ncbi:hypothetical protein Q6272_30520, partial [Klebsiella pneumoniae]|uniref:hypothetical protein n=1 Tax=Klebsiella pneumoniae TaxID=573 RepID=UPI002731216E
GGVYLIVFAILVPETARNVVGNGSIPPQGLLGQSRLQKWQHRRSAGHGAAATLSRKPRKFRFPNPLKALLIIGEKDCAVILFFNAI